MVIVGEKPQGPRREGAWHPNTPHPVLTGKMRQGLPGPPPFEDKDIVAPREGGAIQVSRLSGPWKPQPPGALPAEL